MLLHSDMVKGERAARGKNGGAKRDRQQPAAAGPADDSDDRDQGGRGPWHALIKTEHAWLQAEQVLAGVRHRQRAQADGQDCREGGARRSRRLAVSSLDAWRTLAALDMNGLLSAGTAVASTRGSDPAATGWVRDR